MSPEALDGLEGFSHVWLSFKFHLNTNTLDEAKAFQGVEGSNQKFTFTAKITPPVRAVLYLLLLIVCCLLLLCAVVMCCGDVLW
jgi:hypothetical protein